MNIELIVVGKTDSQEVEKIVQGYAKRVNHYCNFAITTLPDLRSTKKLSQREQKEQEGAAILKQLNDSDYVVLLDERGEEYRSIEFAEWMQKRLNSGVKRVVFIVGGPYGFSAEIYKRSNSLISLSRMTFSHQIIRAIFAEQIYRSFTILRNEPYHHE